MCDERGVHDAVAGGQDPVGRHQHAAAAADVGEPRHGLGGDGLAADDRAGRRGAGEAQRRARREVRVMLIKVSVQDSAVPPRRVWTWIELPV